MLTVKQAAMRVEVSESLVYRWIADGVLTHYRLGGRGKRGTIRIAAEDIDQLMATFKVPAGQGRVSTSVPISSGLPASPFSELDPKRLSRAWDRKPR